MIFLSKYLMSRKIYENVFVWFGVSWRHSSYDVVYIFFEPAMTKLKSLQHKATDIGNDYKYDETPEYFLKKVLLIFSCPATRYVHETNLVHKHRTVGAENENINNAKSVFSYSRSITQYFRKILITLSPHFSSPHSKLFFRVIAETDNKLWR